MATYERRGRGWRVRWRSLDGGARSRACPDATTAKQLVAEVERAHALGRDWSPEAGPAADLPAVLSAYLEDCTRLVEAPTIRLRGLVLEMFAQWLAARNPRSDMPPSLLTRDALSAWHGHLLAARGVCRNTAGAYVKMVMAAWTWAHDSDAFGADVPRPRKPTLPAEDPLRRVAAPTWGDMDAAIDAARSRGVEWYARTMTVMRFTGLRAAWCRGSALE